MVKVKRDAPKSKKTLMLQQISMQNHLLKQFEQEEADLRLQQYSNKPNNSVSLILNEKLSSKHDSILTSLLKTKNKQMVSIMQSDEYTPSVNSERVRVQPKQGMG